MTKTKQEVATIDETSKSVALNDEMNAALMEDAGAGQELMDRNDFAIPRLGILQALSPQVGKRNAEYIQGAEEGMLFDNIENKLYDGEEGVIFIPVSYRRAHIEWKSRAAGGGFVADYGTSTKEYDSCEVDEKGAHITADGNEIVPTAEYFGIVYDAATDTTKRVVFSMAKSQLKKARRWNTLINQLQVKKPDGSGSYNPAIFYMAYKITTVPESSDQGNWFGVNVAPHKPTHELGGIELYMAAREFRKSVLGGEVKASSHINESTEESEDAPM